MIDKAWLYSNIIDECSGIIEEYSGIIDEYGGIIDKYSRTLGVCETIHGTRVVIYLHVTCTCVAVYAILDREKRRTGDDEKQPV